MVRAELRSDGPLERKILDCLVAIPLRFLAHFSHIYLNPLRERFLTAYFSGTYDRP